MRDPSPPSGDRLVDQSPIKVLYIAGSGRSGSTILCQLLGELEGFFCGGELSDFWDRYLGENRLCACGVEFRSCKVWSHIVQQGMSGIGPSEARAVAGLHMRIGRTQHLPLLLIPPLRRFVQPILTRYTTHLAILYRAIQSGTGCRVIVDSSKFPSYAWILRRVPGIELFLVHLVRDPRAVAFSWTRIRPPGQVPTRIETPRFGTTSSSLRWLARNLLTERLWGGDPRHYQFLRYEDFISDPQRTIDQILEFVDERPRASPFVGSHAIRLGDNHIVWGNRTRFLRGVVDLRPDAEWKTRIKRSPRLVVEAMTWGLMRRYGYETGKPISRDPNRSGDPG